MMRLNRAHSEACSAAGGSERLGTGSWRGTASNWVLIVGGSSTESDGEGRKEKAMTVAAILESRPSEVVTVTRDTLVRDAAALLSERKIGAVPVIDGKSVAGIMSERDIINCLVKDGAAILDWPVERIMTAPAITVEPDKTVLAALSLMTSRRIRHLPVLDGKRLIGIVSIGDLVKYRLDKIESEAEAMLTYIQTV
jgi:CBS domain-containing protein